MNSRYIFNTLGKGALMLLLAQGVGACTDVNEWDTDSAFDRLFGTRRSALSVTPSAITAEVTWESTPETKYYLIEASTDSLYDEIPMGESASLVFGKDASVTSSPYVLTGLKGETTYYLRIKSMADNRESKWVYLDEYKFTTKAEQILNDVVEGDITDESIRITWDAALAVTHITYQKSEEETLTHNLTEEEKAAGVVTLEGLDPMVTYTITIYNGDTKRGSMEVTTKAAVMVESAVNVDAAAKKVTFTWGEEIGRLTGYVLLEGEVYPSNEPQTALTPEQETARTLTFDNLKGNTIYTVAVMRNRTVRALQTFKTWAAIPADYAQVQAGSVEEWDAALASANGKLAVVMTGDIDLTGGGTAKIPANVTSLLVWGGDVVTDQKTYTFKTKGLSFLGDMDAVEFYNVNLFANGSTNNYVFDFNGSKANINTISLTSCVVDETRGVFRLRSSCTGSIQNIVVEDCFIRNIGSYGFVAQEGSGLTLSSITLKNTTYVPHSSGKCLIQNKGGNEINVNVDQCTLYGFTYAILDNQKSGFSLNMTNSLMGGMGKNKFFQSMTTATINKVENVFLTSESSFETTIGETTVKYADKDFFEDPGTQNFAVKVDDYKNYGDQRWNK